MLTCIPSAKVCMTNSVWTSMMPQPISADNLALMNTRKRPWTSTSQRSPNRSRKLLEVHIQQEERIAVAHTGTEHMALLPSLALSTIQPLVQLAVRPLLVLHQAQEKPRRTEWLKHAEGAHTANGVRPFSSAISGSGNPSRNHRGPHGSMPSLHS